MILRLVRRLIEAELDEAVEQWMQEIGLPLVRVQEVRSRPLAQPAEDEEQADADAAAALGVEDDESPMESLVVSSAPSEARLTAPIDERGPGRNPEAEELLAWLVPALERQATTAEIARAVAEQRHDLNEEAQRSRRGRKQDDPAKPSSPLA